MKNVRDEWQDKSDDEIKELRDTVPLIVVTENTGDFNKSSILRTAEFYGASEFWIVGKKAWDRRGAVGAHHRITMRHFETWDEVFSFLSYAPDYYEVVALEQSPKAHTLPLYAWQSHTVLLVGEEGNGLQSAILDRCDHMVEIERFGAGRSLNVAAAAAIAINSYSDYVRGKS